jgi:transposase
MLTYKYRIKDRRARKVLCAHAYAVNQVWNYAVAQQRDTESRYRAGAPKRKWASHYDLQHLCKGAGTLLGINQQSVGGVCRAFAQSRDKLKHAPRFRASFGTKRALGWIPFETQSRQHDSSTVTYLGKTYRLFGTAERPIPENAKGGTFVEDSLGRWYVCFYVPVERRPSGVGKVGIDLGLRSLATLSSGYKAEAPRIYRQYEQRLATLQRARRKQSVRRLHARLRNCRRDYLHKLSTQLAARYAFIAVGNVSAKRLASKSVLDAGWSVFRNMLRYKSLGYVDVDEKFTTVTCSACGARRGPKGQKGLRIREWECSSCGISHDRDVNAARNILAIALSAQRLVEESREDSWIGIKNQIMPRRDPSDKHECLDIPGSF